MSAKEKFGEMTDSQLMDYMECNPGASAKAFSFWWETHESSQGKQKTVYRDKVRTETVYEDRIVEVEVERKVKEPLNKVFIGVSVVSLFFSVLMGGSAVMVSAENESLESQVQVTSNVELREVEVPPSDYWDLKNENQTLRIQLRNRESVIDRLVEESR